MEYTSQSHEGTSLVCLSATKSQSGEDKKGKLWQRPALSHWGTKSPGQRAHSLFVRMLRQWENNIKNL